MILSLNWRMLKLLKSYFVFCTKDSGWCWSGWLSFLPSTSTCLNHLQWPSLHDRRKYFAICKLHSIFYGQLPIPFHEYFHFSKSQTRSHSLSINLKPSSINPYRYSFFINTPFLWNSIPVSILKISQTKLFRSALRRFLFK